MEGHIESATRGTKRKADDPQDAVARPMLSAAASLGTSVFAPRRIQALSQDVVNKIAAGEIIVAPVHALKELLENAIDAGALQLEIVVKDGGLKLLQITDNGCGIHKDDLSLLCERFTTSKLKKFEDLTEIATYGFRGEALASISHIAHLAVTTRTSDSSCAWRAQYSDGKLVSPKPNQSADPKPTAGRQGTQITVEDLFYNVPTRRRAFRSASEEYAKILDLVGRYAIHTSNVSFSCKKHGESGMGLSVPSNAATIDRIRQIHGSAVANELIPFDASSEKWGFKSDGWISNANFSVKKTTFILFINHRAVESPNIKKALEHMYSTFLTKGGHPFIYVSLDIEPQRLDVNVHPTKREVHFLHEDEIIDTLCEEARTALGNVDTSRTFMTQTLLPNARILSSNSMGRPGPPATPAHSSIRQATTPVSEAYRHRSAVAPSTAKKTPRPYDNDLVRTDARERKITSMLASTAASASPGGVPNLEPGHSSMGNDDMEYEVVEKEATVCRLRSIKELRGQVRECIHNELTDVFASHTFVGIVDPRRRIVAIQSGVKLYLVDYGMVANEYFYQLGLTNFGNFGSVVLDPPLELNEVLSIGAEQERDIAGPQEGVDWDEVVEKVQGRLLERRDMLEECFSLQITEDGKLTGLPLLIKGYMPPLTKLPSFLLRLGPFVDWTEEQPCFHSFLRELAAFYVPECVPLPPAQQSSADSSDVAMQDADDASEMPGASAAEDPEIVKRRDHLYRALENVMFPAFKARLVATKGLLKGVVEIANLKGLYRVFERC